MRRSPPITRTIPRTLTRKTITRLTRLVILKAASDAAFHRLVARFVGFYSDNLLNEHWGESITFGADNTFTLTMVFQGMDEARPRAYGGRSSTGSRAHRKIL
jgi:hypothetical protein